MNTRTPTLRKHHTGHFFCRWGGKDHFFGADKKAAEAKYLASLKEWAEWRGQRNTLRFPPIGRSERVRDIIDLFLAHKHLEGGDDLRRYYAKHLKRFSASFGMMRADMIRPAQLLAVRDEMLRGKYANKTINHDLGAVKALFLWASTAGYIPEVSFRGIKSQPLGPPPDKAMPKKAVQAMIARAPSHVAAWLAINYLCLMRPTEVVRVVHQEGGWTDEGIFRLDRGKIDLKARMARHVVFSPLALEWLPKCEPVWSRLDSYSSAVRKACGAGGPHPLRHSAATHLLLQGVERAKIDLLLGHAPPRVSLTYAPVFWPPLRETAALLSL